VGARVLCYDDSVSEFKNGESEFVIHEHQL